MPTTSYPYLITAVQMQLTAAARRVQETDFDLVELHGGAYESFFLPEVVRNSKKSG